MFFFSLLPQKRTVVRKNKSQGGRSVARVLSAKRKGEGGEETGEIYAAKERGGPKNRTFLRAKVFLFSFSLSVLYKLVCTLCMRTIMDILLLYRCRVWVGNALLDLRMIYLYCIMKLSSWWEIEWIFNDTMMKSCNAAIESLQYR